MAASKSECVGECQCVFLYTETLWLLHLETQETVKALHMG